MISSKNLLTAMLILLVSACETPANSKDDVASSETLYEMIRACAGGSMSDELSADLKGAVNRWREGLIKGEYSRYTATSFLESFKDEQVRLEAYKIYVECLDGKIGFQETPPPLIRAPEPTK